MLVFVNSILIGQDNSENVQQGSKCQPLMENFEGFHCGGGVASGVFVYVTGIPPHHERALSKV